MAISRKEILPETTVEVKDIEMWIDTELNKSANQEILKTHGVLILIDYNTKYTKDDYNLKATIITNPLYDSISKIYESKGWKFDYIVFSDHTYIKLS